MRFPLDILVTNQPVGMAVVVASAFLGFFIDARAATAENGDKDGYNNSCQDEDQ